MNDGDGKAAETPLTRTQYEHKVMFWDTVPDPELIGQIKAELERVGAEGYRVAGVAAGVIIMERKAQ